MATVTNSHENYFRRPGEIDGLRENHGDERRTQRKGYQKGDTVWWKTQSSRPVHRDQPRHTVLSMLQLGTHQSAVPRHGQTVLLVLHLSTHGQEPQVRIQAMPRTGRQRIHLYDNEVCQLPRIPLHNIAHMPGKEAGHCYRQVRKRQVENDGTREAG